MQNYAISAVHLSGTPGIIRMEVSASIHDWSAQKNPLAAGNF
jgi:hypothetical protein